MTAWASRESSRRCPRLTLLAFACGLSVLTFQGLHAFPDDTPWGRAPMEACQDCHTFYDPVENSEAIMLEGLPERIEASGEYRLVLKLSDEAMRRAGFRIIASADGEPGRFEPADARTEADGDRLRSTEAGSEVESGGETEWTFVWHAPAEGEAAISFDVSANASDDDASPLGDVIHLRTFEASF